MIKKITDIYKDYFSIKRLTINIEQDMMVSRDVFTRENSKNTGDSVAALVYDTNLKQYIFVEQLRAGLYRENNMYITEIVAGTLEHNEDPNECIKREVLEEIGYEVDMIEKISEFYVSPGGSSEKIYLYYIEVSNKVADGGGLESENEFINIIYKDLDEVRKTIFKDAKTIIALNSIL